MTEGDRVAVVTRVLPASPAVVYAEWLDPAALGAWMCPHPARATRVVVEPHVGGQLLIDIEEDGTVFRVEGTYLELRPPSHIRFTWRCSTWDDPNIATEVTVTLEAAANEQTLMTIRHELLPDGLIERHQHGWYLISQQLEHALHHNTSP